MKKIFSILLALTLIFMPLEASAKSHKVDFTCDAKQEMSDGTFYMTCHLLVTSDYEINHIEGSLILKNVTLESIKTNSDWVSNNGNALTTDFTASTGHTGSYSVADFIFTGDLSATECSALYNPTVIEKETENHVCAIVDDVYYGKDGSEVSKETYYEDCCNYTCTVIDNQYYFNSKGESVTYDEMLNDCGSPENPKTGIDYGYVILPIGIVSIIAILKFAKKNTKIYKI